MNTDLLSGSVHIFNASKVNVTLKPENQNSNAIKPVPEDLQPSLGNIAIYEWTSYLLKGDHLEAVKLGCETLTPLDAGLYRFTLKNRVGRLNLRVKQCGNWHHLPLLVLSPKYPTPEVHQQFFGTLLKDLVRRSANLPFSVAQTTAFAADESPQPPTSLFVYHFLRQYAPQIKIALQTILSDPHRTLTVKDQLVPLTQADTIDGGVITRILTEPQYLARTSTKMPIAVPLKGYAPTHLWQTQAQEIFNTAPNRFALTFLAELVDWGARLQETGWLAKHLPAVQPVLDDLNFARTDPLWQEVGLMKRLPVENQVLLKRHGYHNWTDLWRQFHQSRIPIWRQAEEAIDARDIATLYEVWVFFALVDRLRQISPLTIEPVEWHLNVSDEHGLAHGSRVIFGKSGYTLSYNEGFGRSPQRSYSVSLRPDFTLHGPAGIRILFDAKFRFERRIFDEADTESETPQSSAKKDDLYKMHTYRDALRAQSVLTLYPGTQDIFYHTTAQRSDGIDWPALIQGEWPGIGAVSFTPYTGEHYANSE